jgi:hypothetical protein
MWRMRQKDKGYQAHNSSLTPGARGRAGALQVAGFLSPPPTGPSYWYRAPLRVGDIAPPTSTGHL